MTETTSGPPAELQLDGWRVHPSLNRLTRGGETVRLEPKVMDVLLLLARRAGQVVSKDEIADAVWPNAYLSESVVTRALAELRRSLGDDVRAPRYIETIAKRGYRLLIPPVAVDSPPLDPAPARRPAEPLSSPYTVGQWVRGERFLGRTAEMAEILRGPRNGVWVLGTRAVGKTSLLKQLEHLTANDPEGGYFPLFWDLQGSVEPAGLAADFLAALADAEDRLLAFGLPLSGLEGDDLFATLGRLRRAVRARGRTLLLLWDEVEELLHLHRADPTLLRKLRRALQSQEGIRTVMASGPRLWKLAEQRDDTSPFLHGFAPPLYLGPLDGEAARELALQGWGGGGPDGATLGELVRRSGGHPSVLQLLCARTLELGDLDRATAAVAADPTVRLFFAVDFDLLRPEERTIVLELAGRDEREAGRGEPATDSEEGDSANGAETRAALLHLERLGMLRRSEGGGAEIASALFRRWLRDGPALQAPPDGPV